MSDITVNTTKTERTTTSGPTPRVSATTERHTTVRSATSDRLTAWNVRDFVKAMDAAGVPDRASIDVHRSQVGHATSLAVRFSETLDEPEHEEPEPEETP